MHSATRVPGAYLARSDFHTIFITQINVTEPQKTANPTTLSQLPCIIKEPILTKLHQRCLPLDFFSVNKHVPVLFFPPLCVLGLLLTLLQNIYTSADSFSRRTSEAR